MPKAGVLDDGFILIKGQWVLKLDPVEALRWQRRETGGKDSRRVICLWLVMLKVIGFRDQNDMPLSHAFDLTEEHGNGGII